MPHSRPLLAVNAKSDQLIPALTDAWAGGPAVLVVDPQIEGPLQGQFFERFKPTHVHKEGAPVTLPFGVGVSDDTMLVIPTSGSEGVAKGVCLSKHALKTSVELGLQASNSDPSIPWLCCLPLTHIGGLLTVLRGFVTGVPTVIHDGFDIHALAELATPHHISLVPTMAQRLMLAGVKPEKFGTILIGGAAVPQPVKTYFPDAYLTYGMTETAGGVVYNGQPFPGVSAQTTPQGRIRIGGPTIMEGYRDADQPADGIGLDDDGWFTSNDVGEMDETKLTVTGRMDSIIITGGEKVLAHTVEDRLADHELVVTSCVIGIPDPEWGQRVVAVIVPVNPQLPGLSERLGSQAVKDFVRETLPDYYAPKDVLLVRALPELAHGKVDRVGITQTVAAMYMPREGGGCCGGSGGGGCGSASGGCGSGASGNEG